MGIGCLFDLSMQFFQLEEHARSATSTQFLRGVSPGVASGLNSPVDQHEGGLICLQVAQLEMTCLVLLCCLSRWWGNDPIVRGELGRQNFNKND